MKRKINRHSVPDKFCYECGVKLIKDNSYLYNWKRQQYHCKSCISSNRKDYYKKNKSKLQILSRNYYRRRRLSHGKTTIRLAKDKRKYPDDQICELCHKKVNRLVYHHWNEEEPWKGMWICLPCHSFVEGLEKGLTPEDYFNLKRKIENEY